MKKPVIVGILNITSDSFSDGGKFLDAKAALMQAKRLAEDGADVIEISGASSNPRSASVSAPEQIRRMEPVREVARTPVSVDASNREVQRWALEKNVAYLNDIKGFPDASLYPELARSSAKLIVMHAITDTEKADRAANTTDEVLASLYAFFEERIPALERAGIVRERLIIDPGMGFFLSSRPEPSYAVLEDIPHFKEHFALPVMISVSRKSFLRGSLPPEHPDVATKTLELEVRAIERGADYIRTHDPRQLRDAVAGK